MQKILLENEKTSHRLRKYLQNTCLIEDLYLSIENPRRKLVLISLIMITYYISTKFYL